MRAADEAWNSLLANVAPEGPPVPFDPGSLASEPEPVRRYFSAAIAPGTPLARAAALTMRGSIRIGRWLPFRARQLLLPALGTVWIARAGAVLSGYDSYVDEAGRMDWRLLGGLPVMRAAGPDVSTSTAGRVAGESVWVPTAVVPPTCAWRAEGAGAITASVGPAAAPTDLHHQIDGDGQLLRSSFERWGDPERTGAWGHHRFHLDVHDHRTFDGVTIPAVGEVGWEGDVFFRFEVRSYRLVV